jgi:hypothetical protein
MIISVHPLGEAFGVTRVDVINISCVYIEWDPSRWLMEITRDKWAFSLRFQFGVF